MPISSDHRAVWPCASRLPRLNLEPARAVRRGRHPELERARQHAPVDRLEHVRELWQRPDPRAGLDAVGRAHAGAQVHVREPQADLEIAAAEAHGLSRHAHELVRGAVLGHDRAAQHVVVLHDEVPAGTDEAPEPAQHRDRVVHVQEQQAGVDEVERRAGNVRVRLDVDRLEAAVVMAGAPQ